MKNKIRQVTSTPKKVATHVYARRGRYCAVAGFIAGATALSTLDISVSKEALAFIESKDLTEEFYTATESFVQ